MIKKFAPFLLLSLFFGNAAYSQLTEPEKELQGPSVGLSTDLDYSINLHLKGLGSSREQLPFWLYHNQRGRVSRNSNVSSWISGRKITYLNRESILLIGAGVLLDDERSGTVAIDELFVYYQNPLLRVSLGRKQDPEYYNGISSSNGSIFWSLNARPMPGLEIGTNGPLFFSGDSGFGIEGSWNEYLMGNDRFVKGARTHHKELRLVLRTENDWEFKAGMQHIVQWAGVSPRHGQQPDSFEDYLRIVTGQEGGSTATESDQMNALGNHLGGYEVYVSKEFRNFEMELFYNHLFEDGSGRRLGNTPDGRYGIFLARKDKERLIHSLMYELYYTQHQSHTTSGAHKYDNYFHNGTYRSGWTYENRTIGSPFFTANPEGIGIINNKFNAHHLGIAGQLGNFYRKYPYKLLLSYAHNDGRYTARFRPKQDVFYGLFDILLLQRTIDVNLQLGVEYNTYTAPVYGAGVHLVYKL